MEDLQFYAVVTVFQSYKDDGWMVIKGLSRGPVLTFGKILPERSLNPGLLDQLAQGSS